MRDRLLSKIQALIEQRRGAPLAVPDDCKDAPCCNNGWCVPCGMPCPEVLLDNGDRLNLCHVLQGKGQYSLARNVCGGCRHNSEGRCSECCCSVMENEPACDGYEPR